MRRTLTMKVTDIMLTSNMDNFGVHFIGKNYSTWEFQFRLFVMGKELWGHIDGNDLAPTKLSTLAQWQVKDARAEYVDIIYVQVPTESLATVQKVHEQSKRDQFLMKLRPEYEATHSNLMIRDPSPSLDQLMGEVRGETCHKFNVLAARNTDILLLTVQRNLETITVVGSTTVDKSTLTLEMVQ
ncbi:hypothetical protein FEM48_Zijuj11G0049200 [Ziziphus jujuba var. spinosa]|uniref:Retrotransposon Copia-like N-terminal domain-containing protein n=1 Tax=Ziziphus jujuba var. spinosa TaxID=714518 RepID=A0A978UGY6_ZIZJJ|nr:hypothetical protein FEM48_Zijuj11G0049200 [Ziziphus jujuba var. spinosa]